MSGLTWLLLPRSICQTWASRVGYKFFYVALMWHSLHIEGKALQNDQRIFILKQVFIQLEGLCPIL